MPTYKFCFLNLLFLSGMRQFMQQNLRIPVKAIPFFLGLILGLYFITLNITGHTFANYPGDLGDSRFINYIFEHGYKFFKGEETSFWNAPFMFPEHDIITYSDNVLGTTPFYSFFRLSGFDRETSFQLWYVLMVVLNYSCCYWFLVKLFRNRYAAVLGAMIFAFSMGLQSQVTHPQLFVRFPIPLTFLAGIFFYKELQSKYFFLMLLLIAYQFYCVLYYGFMLCIPAALYLFICLIYKHKTFFEKIKSIKWLVLMLFSVIANMLLLLPLMLPYHERLKGLPYNQFPNIFLTIPTVKSFFYSQPGNPIWKCLEKMCENYETPWNHQLFPGEIAMISAFIFAAIIIMALILKKTWLNSISEVPCLIFLIIGFITFILFVRFGSFSLYKYVMHIPGFGSMRALQRIINIHLLFFSIAVTFVFSLLFNKTAKLKIPVFLAASFLLIADNYYPQGKSYSTPKQVSQLRVNSLMEKMKTIPKGSIVSCETEKNPDDIVGYILDAMLATQSLGLKCLEGYTGYCPAGYERFWKNMDAEGRKKWIAYNKMNANDIYIIPF